jgi:hypothetical protein
MGITRKQAWANRQLAAIPKDVLQRHLEERGEKNPYHGLRKLAASYAGAAYDNRVKIRTDDPARAAWVIVNACSPGFVEELVAFLAEYLRAENEAVRKAGGE